MNERITSTEELGGDEIDRIFSLAIAEDEDERVRREGGRIARRLAIAFVLVLATGAVCWVVLPQFGMVLPAPVVLLVFGVMAFASLAPLFEDRPSTPAPREEDPGRPITCCGVRPVGEMSRKRQGDGGSCGCS